MSRDTPVERWKALTSSSNESDINDILNSLSLLSEKESHQTYRNWYETQEVRDRYPRNFFNIVDNKGQTLLHKIAESSNLNVTVMNKLIEEYVQAMNRSAYTKSMMKLKLDMDTKTQYYEPVDINIKDNEGRTPLILAIQTKKSDKINYLLSRPEISVDCFMMKLALDKQLDKAIILQIISKIDLDLDCPQEISQAELTALANEKGFYKADTDIITALELFMANKSEKNYIVSAPNNFEKIKRSAGVTIMHTNNAIAKMAKPIIDSVKTQLPEYLKTIIESSYSGAKPFVIGTAQFSYYVLFLFVGLMVVNYINNIAILLIQGLRNFVYNSYSEITQLISQCNGYNEILNSFIALFLNIIDPSNYIKLLDIPGNIVFLTRIILEFGSGIYKSLGYLYNNNNNNIILSFQRASNSFIEFIPEIQDYPELVILFAILGTLYFLYTFYEETSNQVEIPTSYNPSSKRKNGRYLSPSRNKKGGGKINNLDDVLKIFADKTPGLDDFVDDILQYVVDIINTIDKSVLDQIGIKPEDISQINVEYIKNINFEEIKELKMPIEFYQDIYVQIRDVKGQFAGIKADAEARVEQMEEMKQSEADVRYGKEFQVTSGLNQGMRVGSMGGKQKRSRRKHNKSKSVKRKRSIRKHSRRKNRK
jgi:hypothetical protein